MTERLTIAQLIAESKRVENEIDRHRVQMDLIIFYRKDCPFRDGRTIEEYTNKMKEDMQSYMDMQKRLFALKSALCKANRETTLKVPGMPVMADIIAGKKLEEEEITIAEAINRKVFFKSVLARDAVSLVTIFTNGLKTKAVLDREADIYVAKQLEKQFPSDMKASWSVEKYNEAKKRETAATEVIRVDPCGLVENNAIKIYSDEVQKYITTIDSLLSQVNASTFVEFEY